MTIASMNPTLEGEMETRLGGGVSRWLSVRSEHQRAQSGGQQCASDGEQGEKMVIDRGARRKP